MVSKRKEDVFGRGISSDGKNWCVQTFVALRAERFSASLTHET